MRKVNIKPVKTVVLLSPQHDENNVAPSPANATITTKEEIMNIIALQS